MSGICIRCIGWYRDRSNFFFLAAVGSLFPAFGFGQVLVAEDDIPFLYGTASDVGRNSEPADAFRRDDEIGDAGAGLSFRRLGNQRCSCFRDGSEQADQYIVVIFVHVVDFTNVYGGTYGFLGFFRFLRTGSEKEGGAQCGRDSRPVHGFTL